MKSTLFTAGALVLGLVSLSGCKPDAQQATGQYYREKDAGLPLALNLKTDGTFDSYNGDQTGKWHLVDDQLFSSTVELDGNNDFGKYADQYHLTRHNGAFCIETRVDYEYWCKRR